MQPTEMDWQNVPEMDSDLMNYNDEQEVEGTDDGYYDDEYGYEDEGLADSKVTLTDVLDQCILPTSSQVVSTIYPLLGLCLACRVIAIIIAEGTCLTLSIICLYMLIYIYVYIYIYIV